MSEMLKLADELHDADPEELMDTDLLERVEAALRCSADSEQPKGWKLVPIKPNRRQIVAGCENNPTQWTDETPDTFSADVANDVYVSMVAAAPTCTEPQASADSAHEWRPIETAPEDVPVWGWQPPQNDLHDCYGTVALLEKVEGCWFSHHDGEETFTPTCWMPANKPRRPSTAPARAEPQSALMARARNALQAARDALRPYAKIDYDADNQPQPNNAFDVDQICREALYEIDVAEPITRCADCPSRYLNGGCSGCPEDAPLAVEHSQAVNDGGGK